MADKKFKDYYNELTEASAIPSGGKILVQTGNVEPEKIDPFKYVEDKLDKGGYSGTAQDLKEQIDLSNSLTGTERYATLAEVNALINKDATIQYLVDSDGDLNGYYTWDGVSDTVEFNRPLSPPLIVGKNKYNSSLAEDGKYVQNGTGNVFQAANFAYTGKIPVLGNQEYTLKNTVASFGRVHFYDAIGDWISEIDNASNQVTFTTPSNAEFIASWGIISGNTFDQWKAQIQLEIGGIATDFESYKVTYEVSSESIEIVKPITIIKKQQYCYVRTNFNVNKDLVQRFTVFEDNLFSNNVVNFSGVWLIDKTSLNDVNSLTSGLYIATQGDDAAPIRYNNTYIGANHGIDRLRIVTAASHGKTSADIGSEYNRNGSSSDKWYIIRVVDNNTLWMLSENWGTESIWGFRSDVSGILNYVQGGNTTNNITVASFVNSQLFPAIKNARKKVLIDDDVEVSQDGMYYSNEVNIVDTYDIVNPSVVLDNLILNTGRNYNDQELNEAYRNGDTSVSLAYNYNIQKNGAIQISASIRNHTEIDLSYAGLIQAAAVGGYTDLKLLHPKALPVTVGARTYDFREPTDFNTAPTGEINITSNLFEIPTSPPDRIISLVYDGVNSKYGFAMGYDISKGAGANRGVLIDSSLQIFTSRKQYPRLIDDKLGNLAANSYSSGVAYRHFFDTSDENKNKGLSTTFYYYINGNSLNVVIDYHTQVEFDSLKLPLEYLGKDISIIEKTDNVTIHSEQVGETGIVLSVGSGDYGYAILKIH